MEEIRLSFPQSHEKKHIKKKLFIKVNSFKKQFLLLILSFLIMNVSISDDDVPKDISFGVVPQQTDKKLRRLWMPLVKRLSKETGLEFVLESSPDIGTFQSRMLAGKFDIAYSNPLLYIIANSSIGYQAIAREENKKLHSIIVVKKDSEIYSIEDLAEKSMVFPEHAFAATVLTQSFLNNKKIPYAASFVFSHDAAYKFVSLGKYVAAGGVQRTFDSLEPEIKARLMVLKKFDGVTPHAFSVHPRISSSVTIKIQEALRSFSDDAEGREILTNLRMGKLGAAVDADWNDVRKVMSSR